MKYSKKHILVQYVLLFKARLDMDVQEFEAIIDKFELCSPVCDDDIIIAMTKFADYWEKFKLPINLSLEQKCIYDILKNHFITSKF